MVLRTLRAGGVMLVVALTLVACIKPPETAKLAQPAGVTTAWVMTYPDRPEVSPVPDAVDEAIVETLGARNLQSRPVPFDTIAEPFQRKRSTDDRLALLAGHSDQPFVMLVETRARYYSLLSGRFRWNVDLKATIAATNDLQDRETQNWELAAFLDFDHQNEVEALEYSAATIANRIGRLTDQFLGALDGQTVRRTVPTRPKKKAERAKSEEVSPTPAEHPLAAGSAIYFVMVDRFHNGEPANDGTVDPDDPQAFHGGDLQGVRRKLDWLDELGITTIWLSPVFEMREEKFHGHGAFHGYWVEDFGAIEDRFGGREALGRLSEALDERQMHLMLDVVLNHVSFDAPLVAEKPDWFHGEGGITDWSDRTQILTHDVHGLPDLAQENEEVYQHLLGHSLGWIEALGPAGFRLDAVKHVPNEFWVKYNAAIAREAGSDFVMLGEVLDGEPATVARTVREGDFNAIFDFPLHFAMIDVFCRDAHPGRLASILYADRQYPASIGDRREGLVTLLDNHDLPRVLSACQNERERVIDALAFMLSARGTPSFTWGTESGATGTKEPDNRSDMVFEMHPIGEAMKTWLDLRREYPVLASGEDRILALDEDLFVYARADATHTAVVAVNQGGEQPLADTLGSDRSWTNLESGARSTSPTAAPGVTVWLSEGRFDDAASGNIPVEFRVDGAPRGEVRIVGSGPEFGDWDPREAPRGGVISVPEGGAFAVKAVVVQSDGSVKWQSGGNQFVFVDGSEPVTIRWQ